MSQRRWLLPAVLVLCVLAIPATFHGDIIGIVRLTPPPHLVGHWLSLGVAADDPTGEYMVESRCAGDPPGEWSLPWFQSDPVFEFAYMGNVATYDLRFWAEEQPDPEGPLVWDDETIQVSILGPDNDVVTAGSLGVDSTDNELEVRFIVVRGASQIGGEIAGRPQEKIIFQDNVTGFTTYSPGWPNWLDGNQNFYWDSSSAEIVDIKSYDMTKPAVQNKPVGFVLADVWHTNRLVIKGCEDEDQYFAFATKHFQKIKTGADTWKLVEAED